MKKTILIISTMAVLSGAGFSWDSYKLQKTKAARAALRADVDALKTRLAAAELETRHVWTNAMQSLEMQLAVNKFEREVEIPARKAAADATAALDRSVIKELNSLREDVTALRQWQRGVTARAMAK